MFQYGFSYVRTDPYFGGNDFFGDIHVTFTGSGFGVQGFRDRRFRGSEFKGSGLGLVGTILKSSR
jgi:hypothetical protein